MTKKLKKLLGVISLKYKEYLRIILFYNYKIPMLIFMYVLIFFCESSHSKHWQIMCC